MPANITASGAASEANVALARQFTDALERGDFASLAKNMGDASITTKGQGATVTAEQAAQYAQASKPAVEVVYVKVSSDHLTAKIKFTSPPQGAAGAVAHGTALISATVEGGKVVAVDYEQDIQSLHQGLGVR